MTRNPILNAFSAGAYIAVLVCGIWYAPQVVPESVQLGVLIPITMLSLFVLSAAMMGVFFLLQPLLLCFEGNPRQGAKLFLQTVGCFACMIALLIGVLLSVSFLQ